MLGDSDLTLRHEIENVRRSIATLPAGAPALNREEALRLLDELKSRPVPDR